MNALGSSSRALLASVFVLSSAAVGRAAGIAYEVVKSMQTERVGAGPVAPLLEGSDGALYGSTQWAGTNPGTLFKIDKDGGGYQALHVFGTVPNDGANPFAQLIKGPDGLLYGTTAAGGVFGGGILFHISEDGRNYGILWHFVAATGIRPRGALLIGDDGAFYGTTTSGGSSNGGVIYRVRPDGSNYQVLHEFGTSPTAGWNPEAGMIRGSDGVLYGVTRYGGNTNGGTVFRINQDGSGFSTLHHFNLGAPEGGWSKTTVVEASDGYLYGVTERGLSILGAIFKLSKDGNEFSVMHQFMSTGNGQSPWGDLIEGSDNALYGTTYYGAVPNNPSGGVVFRLGLAGGFQVLHRFPTNEFDPVGMQAGVRRGSDGLLYGSAETWGGFGRLFKIEETGSNFNVIFDFRSTNLGGRLLRSPVIAASDRRIYFAAEAGGTSSVGAIYRVDRDGRNPRILRHFGDLGDGRTPNAPMEASDGLLYGSTQTGGAAGQGILYRMGKDGSNYAILRSFAVGILSTDGKTPRAQLLESVDGFLYGTTSFGGLSNRGTIFRIGKDGSNYAVIHDFLLGTNGSGPRDLLEASDGMFYGITTTGGVFNRGTAYRCSRDGSVFEVLHRFDGATDGHAPEGGLIEASDGFIYGTTAGNSTNRGTIFRMQKNGSGYAVISHFAEEADGGRNPKARLIEDVDGRLIGTTSRGGLGNGTVFRIGKDGLGYETLWEFGTISPDALSPVAGLVRDSMGTYYGTAELGGSTGAGAVFRLDPRTVMLSIRRQNSAAVLEWPASSTLDRLEESPSISQPNWAPVSEPAFDIGNRFRVTMPNATDPQRFFRVRRNWQ
jgi:uncharacterized repeat protein (TIGR03803 family)